MKTPIWPCARLVFKGSTTAALFSMALGLGAYTTHSHAAGVSAVRGIEFRDGARNGPRRHSGPRRSTWYRSIDGSANHPFVHSLGQALTPFQRMFATDYSDGISALAGPHRPGPRHVSNLVNAQPTAYAGTPSRPLATAFLWQWGQFIDHDITLSDSAHPAEPVPIPVPADDAHFLPGGIIAFNRSLYDPNSGRTGPRHQLNEVTAWIDASQIYGSDAERARALRTMDGTGRLRMSAGGLLPFNHFGLPNAGGSGDHLFLSGDVRANEQVALTAMHTVFAREHNRIAERLHARNPRWSGHYIYQRVRRLVGAMMQHITYNEFLPALLGRHAMPPYRGYNGNVDGSINNVFAAAAFRFGHSALNPTLLRIDAQGNTIPEGSLSLRDAFFRPDRIVTEGGIEPLLRGLAAQTSEAIDVFVIDDVRNFLFGQPGRGGFDLASLNIQRGRDHGLPAYNEARRELGMAPITRVGDISSDSEVVVRLRAAYASVDDIDLWVGGLAEDPVNGGHLGELFSRIVIRQFDDLRAGDRYWYQRTLSRSERRFVRRSTLANVIRRNTAIEREIGDELFRAGK